jgi:hypothetical protein
MGGRIRRVARVAVLAGAGVSIALAAGQGTAGAQDDKQQIDTAIAYTCDTSHVVLHVTATFPTQGKAGEPVQPADVTLALTVPPEALAPLTGAATATSVVRMDTSIVQGETAASATWGAVQDTPVPLGVDTVFTAAVAPDPVTAGEAGEVTFTAAGLSVALSGQNADGAPTDPPSVALTCVPDADQKTTFATVPMAATEDPTTPTTEEPEPGLKVGTESAPSITGLADIPKECHAIPPAPNATSPQNYCAKMAGYANVAKLNASVLQPAALININAGSFKAKCDNVTGKFCSESAVKPNNPTPEDPDGELRYPVAPGSFYSFGFVPTTGTMQLTQLAAANVHIWFQGKLGLATATLQVSIQLLEAHVNGTEIKLGPNCRSETPVDVVLSAVPGTYSITDGGVLDGTITIPPFSGCGEDEDLDPLITGLVSGPNNYVKMTQSKVCSLGNGVNCPPVAPIPKR